MGGRRIAYGCVHTQGGQGGGSVKPGMNIPPGMILVDFWAVEGPFGLDYDGSVYRSVEIRDEGGQAVDSSLDYVGPIGRVDPADEAEAAAIERLEQLWNEADGYDCRERSGRRTVNYRGFDVWHLYWTGYAGWPDFAFHAVIDLLCTFSAYALGHWDADRRHAAEKRRDVSEEE